MVELGYTLHIHPAYLATVTKIMTAESIRETQNTFRLSSEYVSCKKSMCRAYPPDLLAWCEVDHVKQQNLLRFSLTNAVQVSLETATGISLHLNRRTIGCTILYSSPFANVRQMLLAVLRPQHCAASIALVVAKIIAEC
jgi:hypothetical protein